MGILGNIVVDVLALLVTLGILVTIHEFGHFWVARRCGVKVERFSIGFGKPLLRWRGKAPDYVLAASNTTPAVASAEQHRQHGTEYVVAALPLGGYVKMLGEQDRNVPPQERHLAFNNQSLGRRTAIVAAGPAANFLLAIALYWVMFLSGVSGVAPVLGGVDADSAAQRAGFQSGDEIVQVDGESTRTWQEVRLAMLGRLGETGVLRFTVQLEGASTTRALEVPIRNWLNRESNPDILGDLGLEPFRLDIPARIGELVEGGRARQAGLRTGDLVTQVDGEPLDGWLAWIDIVRANPETDLGITVRRDGTTRQLTLRPELTTGERGDQYGYIGAGVQQPEVMPAMPAEMNREVSYSVIGALPRALGETWTNSVFVLESIKKMLIGLISVENLSGPITIAQVAGETATYGLEYYIGFLAILSISLGVLNLLPIPVLDGGHLFYYLIEAVTRRPVPERIQEMGMQFGLLLIVGITFLAFYNDVNRLF